MGKSGVLEHKSAISLKRVKIDEKLLWRAYRNSPTSLSNGNIPDPLRPPFSKIGGLHFATQAKTALVIIGGTSKAADFKFGRYIRRVHPNKSP